MPFTDLKIELKISYISPSITTGEGISNALRATCLFSSHDPYTHVNLSNMCKTLPRKLQDKALHVSRSIPLHGLRANDFSRKSTRYPILPQGSKDKAVPHGNQGKRFTKHTGKCQQGTRLENLCRFCTIAHSNSQGFVPKRTFRFRTGKYSLCIGLFDNRSVLESFSLGPFSKKKSSHQTAYPVGSAWQHSNLHSDYRRQIARCQYSGDPGSRTRKLLYHGSRLFRLLKAFHNASGGCLFRYPRQIQPEVPSALFAPYRQKHWRKMRSDYQTDRILHSKRLSRKPQANKVLRFKEQKNFCLSHEQFFSTSKDNSRTLPLSLAG